MGTNNLLQGRLMSGTCCRENNQIRIRRNKLNNDHKYVL